MYKVAFYTGQAKAEKLQKEGGFRIGKVNAFWAVYMDFLAEMTKEQAEEFCAMQDNPTNHFIYEC